MKPLLFAVVLALALPACAQTMCSPQTKFYLDVRPTQNVYSCQTENGSIWTIGFKPDNGGELVVTYENFDGNWAYWEKAVNWKSPATYRGCWNDACWKYTQHIYYQLGGANVYFEGPFVVHE